MLSLVLALTSPVLAADQAFYEWDRVTAAEDVRDGDSDQNDFAVRHNSRCLVSDTNALLSHTVNGVALAAGATLVNAVDVQWRSTATAPATVALAWFDAEGVLGAFQELCNGTCATTTTLAVDTRTLFEAPVPAGFINTEPSGVVAAGRPFQLRATWTSAAFASPCDADWQIRNGGGTFDIHSFMTSGPPMVADVPDWCSTGNEADCPPLGTTGQRMSFALPRETVGIDQAYGAPFLAWVADRTDGSPCAPGSCVHEDWYESPVSGQTRARQVQTDTTARLFSQPSCSDAVRNGDETATDCGGTVCAACGDGGWGQAIALGNPTDAQELSPSVAVAGDGTAFVVWYSDASGFVTARRHVPGSGWEAAVDLGAGSTPVIAADDTGRALAVWRGYGVNALMAARFDPGTGWGSPVTVYGDPLATVLFANVDLAPGGAGVIVFDVHLAGNLTVRAAYFDGSTVSPAATISAVQPSYAGLVSVEDRPGGQIAATTLWLQRPSETRSIVTSDAEFPVGATWSTPATLWSGLGVAAPSGVVRGGSQTVAVWLAGGSVLGAQRTATSWTGETGLNPYLNPNFPTVGGNASGKVVAVFEDANGPRELFAATYTPGAGWGTSPIHSPGTYDRVAVAVAPEGGVTVIAASSATAPTNTVRAIEQSEVGTWGAPLELETDSGDDSTEPTVARGPSGHGIAVWVRESCPSGGGSDSGDTGSSCVPEYRIWGAIRD